MKTLVIAEHDNASLKAATLNAVAAAGALGGDVDILVAGAGCGAAADAAADLWSSPAVVALSPGLVSIPATVSEEGLLMLAAF